MMDIDLSLPDRLAGDLDAAFPALIATHQDRLYTIALRLLGNPHDAEEVAQDAFVRAYRACAGYGADRVRQLRLGPWLAAIVVNGARNRRRRASERRPAVPLGPLLELGFDRADERPSPHDRAATRESGAALAQAILELSPAIRAAIVLRHVDGLSLSETAVALGRPEGTVKAQVHRGLARLRQILSAEPDLVERAARSSITARPPVARPAAEVLR
jgi:RNA polymerase sigma-70 factor (ECF subfamily)